MKAKIADECAHAVGDFDIGAVLANGHRADVQHEKPRLWPVRQALAHHFATDRIFQVTRLDDQRIAAIFPDVIGRIVGRPAVWKATQGKHAMHVITISGLKIAGGDYFASSIAPALHGSHCRPPGFGFVALALYIGKMSFEYSKSGTAARIFQIA